MHNVQSTKASFSIQVITIVIRITDIDLKSNVRKTLLTKFETTSNVYDFDCELELDCCIDINGKISNRIDNKMNIEVNPSPPSSMEMMMIVTVNFYRYV